MSAVLVGVIAVVYSAVLLSALTFIRAGDAVDIPTLLVLAVFWPVTAALVAAVLGVSQIGGGS